MEVSQIETNLLTAQEVADLLKVKKSTVYEMIKRGDLPSRKIGKQLRISRADMERLLGAGAQEPPPFSAPTPRSAPAARAGNRLVLCGQDILLDFLTAHLNGTPHLPNLLRARAGSYHGLYQLYLGAVDFATCHLWDEET